MALKYVNAVYPFSSVFARYVCLLGSSSSVKKLEIKEESARGLHPFQRTASGAFTTTTDIVPASALPAFEDLVTYLDQHKPSDQYTYDSKTPIVRGYPVEVYSEIIRFVRMILILEANPSTILIDQYVESKVDNSMADDPVVMDNFKGYIESCWSGTDPKKKEALELWLRFIENSLDKDLKGKNVQTMARFSVINGLFYRRLGSTYYGCTIPFGNHIVWACIHIYFFEGSTGILQVIHSLRETRRT